MAYNYLHHLCSSCKVTDIFTIILSHITLLLWLLLSSLLYLNNLLLFNVHISFSYLFIINFFISFRYGYLSLPGVGRSTMACQRLLEGLVREDVQMVENSLVTVSPKLFRSDAIRLEEGFRARRGCRFRALVDFDQ